MNTLLGRKRWMHLLVLGTMLLSWPTVGVADEPASGAAKNHPGTDAVSDESAPGEQQEQAEHMRRPGIFERRAILRHALRDLDLSEDQKNQIKELFKENKAQLEKFMDEHREEMAKLREDLKAAREKANVARIRELNQQIKEMLNKGQDLEGLIESIKARLTAEQLEGFDVAMERAKDWWDQRMESRRKARLQREDGRGAQSKDREHLKKPKMKDESATPEDDDGSGE